MDYDKAKMAEKLVKEIEDIEKSVNIINSYARNPGGLNNYEIKVVTKTSQRLAFTLEDTNILPLISNYYRDKLKEAKNRLEEL